MATLNTLVLQLVAKIEPFSKGLAQAEQRFAKFQKGLVGKAGTALFSVTALDKGFDALGQAMKRSVENGENFVDVLQETATQALTTLPIIGGLNQALISMRDYLLGDAEELAALNARLASVGDRLGLTAKETARLAAKTKELTAAHDAHAKRISDAQSLVQSLAFEYANLGKSAEELREAEIRATLTRADAVEGWIQEQIAIQRAINAYREMQAEQERLAAAAEQIFEMTRTPLEQFNRELEKLKELFEGGFIDEDTYQRRIKQLEDELKQAEELTNAQKDVIERQQPAIQDQTPAAIERRFAQSFRTPSATDPGLKLLKTAEHTLVDGKQRTQIQKQQLTELQQLNNSLGQFTIYGGLN